MATDYQKMTADLHAAEHGKAPMHTPPGAEVHIMPSSEFDAASGQPYKLHAWLFLPQICSSGKLPPLIIMSHGYSARKDMGLQVMGERYTAKGYAVLAFDFFNLGASEGPENFGQPAPMDQSVRDVKSVVDYAVSKLGGKVDTTHIVLWGTCGSSGPTLTAAYELEQESSNIAAVILQTPNLSSNGMKSAWGLSGRIFWPLWLFVNAIKSRVTGKRCMRFANFENDFGTSRQGYCVMPPTPTLLVMIPQHVLDHKAKHPTYVSVKDIVGMNIAKRVKIAYQGLSAPLLCIVATEEQVLADNVASLSRWAVGNKVGDIQIVTVPGEHFSVYPVVNPEVLVRMKPYMTTTSTTYNHETLPKSLAHQFTFLQKHVPSKL